MVLTVLKAALGFGQSCSFDDCARLRAMLSTLRLPAPKVREEAPDAEEVRRAMDAARALGRPSAAFAYALQYETAARQFDVVGFWVPLSDPRPSSVLASRTKWIGPLWASIDQDTILTIVPSKTERTTKARVRIDLKLCPMTMECIAGIPLEKRVGPLRGSRLVIALSTTLASGARQACGIASGTGI